MKQVVLFFLTFLMLGNVTAQSKKALTHAVYDDWKSPGERLISPDGKYVVYTIIPQEGDGELVIQQLGSNYKKTIERGSGATISNDSRFLFFQIKPPFKATRDARIKKRRSDDMPKDSLGIVELGTDSVLKIPRVKSYKVPEKGLGWLAYHLEKPSTDSARKKLGTDSMKLKSAQLAKLADSIIRQSIDSINGKIEREQVIQVAQKAAREILKKGKDEALEDATDAEGDEAAATTPSSEGTDLVVKNLYRGKDTIFNRVSEFHFDKKGNQLVIEVTKNAKDSNSRAAIYWYQLQTGKIDTVLKGCNDCTGYVMDEKGRQLAFLGERDSSSRALQKFYKLWYYAPGQDSAIILADRNTPGMRLGNTVSENGTISFSKDGRKIFFGVAAIQPAKDTTLVDFELAKLDIWHYNDDYLQPQQLKEMSIELKRSYLAVTMPRSGKVVQLGDETAENISLVNEGNADFVMANSTRGNRIISQWTGRSLQTGYLISTTTGIKTLVKNNVAGFLQISPRGKFVYWYEPEQKNYFTYEVATGITRNITKNIRVPLYNTENDVPDLPRPAGTAGWIDNDQYFLINDEYDIWKVDPSGEELPLNLTNGLGRKTNTTFDYVRLNRDERFIGVEETMLLRTFNKTTKYAGFATKKINETAEPQLITTGPFSFVGPVKADSVEQYIVQRGNINGTELFATSDLKNFTQLTNIAIQQNDYNWLSVELVKWKMFDGKMSEGLLYKPANFDPKKKYPIIFYFYERNADGLYNYRPPAPSASTVNIPYFVSNEYLVFDPNIYYKTGEPGQSAYNSVVSAAKYLAKMPWVDSTRMALQGQSWGGYQIAYLITKTNMFRAAGAGAPVANMTSAYGGIRWGAGINRQFQYEKSQSRIGATLWERPDLYIKNSPLFAADKINTPLLMTHNDADDAVPWYQGIEFFTALRRLNKKVWLLQYNGEAHNLRERRNRKDLSVRLGQFFDYYLKDAPPAKWIKDGLPATKKGINWGLELE